MGGGWSFRRLRSSVAWGGGSMKVLQNHAYTAAGDRGRVGNLAQTVAV